MLQEPTIIGSWLGPIAKTLDDYGIDGVSLLESHGVSVKSIPNPDYRISLDRLKRLWESSVRVTGDEAFGLKAGSNVHPTTFQALGLLLWCSPNLKQLFKYLARYLAVFTTAAQVELNEDDDHYRFCGHYMADTTGKLFATDIGMDATIAALVTACRAHYGDEFSPLKVELSRAENNRADAYENFFCCPVTFSCKNNVLVMDKAQLLTKITQGNQVLADEMETLVKSLLARMDTDDFVGKVYRNLLILLPQGKGDMEHVAESVHMSSRTLHRKLHSKGTNYQRLRDSVRRELALQYIRHSSLSLIDISFLLGFANYSNFARVFKQWKGVSPREYRYFSK